MSAQPHFEITLPVIQCRSRHPHLVRRLDLGQPFPETKPQQALLLRLERLGESLEIVLVVIERVRGDVVFVDGVEIRQPSLAADEVDGAIANNGAEPTVETVSITTSVALAQAAVRD